MVDSTPFKSLCGVATLCAAAIFSLFAVAFVGIAFATDNWQHVTVNRNNLQVTVNTENDTKLNEEFYTDVRYFDRVEGLFRYGFKKFLVIRIILVFFKENFDEKIMF